MKILACIPTLSSRSDYLRNAIRGYRERSAGHDVVISLEYNAPTCGVGWQRCVEQGLRDNPDIDFVHLSNDDVVVGFGWADELVEWARRGCIGAARIEPAGVALGLDPLPIPPPMPPLTAKTGYGYYYSDLPEYQPTKAGQPIDHCSLPFLSLESFKDVGPCIPIHFGTDKFICRDERHQTVACPESVIFNYAAQAGRAHDGWEETDFIDFDLCVAYPRYLSGELQPTEMPPERLTDEGLRLVEQLRAQR